MLVLSFAAAAAIATLPAYTLPPAKRAEPTKSAKCADHCASRYRLAVERDDGPSVKARALAHDGTECNVVGSKLCTSDGYRIWRGEY